MQYGFDVDAATKFGYLSQTISERGSHIGTFTLVENVRASTGTLGVRFTFISASGERAVFTLNTMREITDPRNPKNIKFENLYGINGLNAIATCIGEFKGLTSKVIQAEKWDAKENCMSVIDVDAFPQLMNKEIGCVFIMREYQKKDLNGVFTQEFDWYPEFVGVFEVMHNRTASEIISQHKNGVPPAQGTQLGAMLMHLKDRKLKDSEVKPPSEYVPATNSAERF